MNFISPIVLSVFFLVLQSCARLRPLKNSITITTDKPAQISLWDDKADRFQDLGPTPFHMELNQIRPMIDQSEWIYFVVRSPGFVMENILLAAKQKLAVDIKLKLRPIEWWNDPSNTLPSHIVNQMGRQIQKVYLNIRQGKLDDALSSIEQLILEYPSAAFFHDLKGTILLLLGKKKEAASSYQRSLQISSDNIETIKILNDLKLEGINP
jgi:hypothetical protein